MVASCRIPCQYAKFGVRDYRETFMLMHRLSTISNNVDQDLVSGTGAETVTVTKQKTLRPALFKVLILNDDFTPMEFVVVVLKSIFGMSESGATQLMLAIHRTGVGVAGVFPYEIAETKVHHVLELARQHEHPLQCQLEEE